MANTTHNHFSNQLSLAKFGGLLGGLLFIRQTPMLNAKTHRGLLSNLASRFSAWRERQTAAAELSRLSDRELADIGISRQQIPNVIKNRF